VKALSLTQPWSSLMAIGAKRYETRSWKTPYRGPLLIHAAKGFPREARDLLALHPFCSVLEAAYPGFVNRRHGGLPLGVILARVELVDCVPAETAFDDLFETPLPHGEHERVFGDFSAGRWAWITRGLTRLSTPIPAKGHLSLWDFDLVEEA